MSHTPFSYEAFDEQTAESHRIEEIPRVEDDKVKCFESGYKAGWDDAMRSMVSNDEKRKSEISEAIKRTELNLQEAVRLTTADAMSSVLEILEVLFNWLEEEGVAHIVSQRAYEFINRNASRRVTICATQEDYSTIRGALDQSIADKIDFDLDPNLNQGEAFLSLGATEERVGCSSILLEIKEMIRLHRNRDTIGK